MTLSSLAAYRESGLLIARAGLGIVLLLHGLRKLLPGPTLWEKLAIGTGIHVYPVLFGFAAALALAAGGIFLVLGFCFRFACIVLLVTLVAAMRYQTRTVASFDDLSHAAAAACIFLGLLFVGPGKYSLDRK